MKLVLKVAVAAEIVVLCCYAIVKLLSRRMISEMESYLESVRA